MVLVSVVLVILPLALSPDARVVVAIGFGALLLGVPVFFVFSWGRIRPKVFNKISGMLSLLAPCALYLSFCISREGIVEGLLLSQKTTAL